ncbi:aminoglycoside 6'-N-acetyltransferase [Clostridium amazonitimonense]|uniref:aminoglycoside 6'-N-acetyltransferase n=1 Tax=Clostridium amazonitimonense TaxID=1499689 RepID=UPI000509D6D4|nr:aminoglycoside 6'-N-acetyltransferase [Clostridium amazonitimonense]
MDNNILLASLDNLEDIVSMALELWPDNTIEGLKEEFMEILKSNNQGVLLYKLEGKFIGFNQVSIRYDYVEGSNTSPVGFIEGIFVKESYRLKGVAKSLVRNGEKWAKEKGCTEMGSDVEFHNVDSYNFHKSIGYTEMNRIICFLKDIK